MDFASSAEPDKPLNTEAASMARLQRRLQRLERANRQLHDQARRYRGLFEDNQHPMWLFDVQAMRFIAVNKAAVRHYGWSRDEFLKLAIADILPADEAPIFSNDIEQRARSALSSAGIQCHRKRDGTLIDVEITSNAIEFSGRTAYLVQVKDVTDHLRAQCRLTRLSCLNAMLTQTDELLVRAHSRMDLFDRVCRVAVEQGGFRSASIGLADGDGGFCLVARAGADASHPDMPGDGVDAATRYGHDPIAQTLQSGTCAVFNEIRNDSTCLLCHDAARLGWNGSAAAFPIQSAGQVIGAISLLANNRDFFKKPELAALQRLALGVSFGLDAIARRDERDRLLAEIELAEARWRNALEGAGHFAWEWNAKTDLVFHSPQWKKMLGYDDADIGDTLHEWQSRVHPDDFAAAARAVQRHLCGKEPVYRSEHRLRCKDGSYRWILDQGRVITRTETGAPLTVIGTHTDIGERRRNEELLQASEARYRLLFEANPHPMWVYELASLRFLAVNDAAVAHYGWSRDEFLAMTIADIRPPEETPRLLEDVARPETLTATIVRRHRRRDDTLIDVEISRHAIEFDGRSARLVLAHDITERLRAERAVRESERLARSTLDSLSAHIAILDGTGSIVAVNAAWRHFSECNGPVAGDVCDGANYLAVCDRAEGDGVDTARAFAAGIRDVLSGKASSFDLEYPAHSPTQQRWFVGRVTRFIGEGPLRVVVSHRDITARKLAELAVAASERRFRAAFEQAAVGMAHAAAEEGRFLMVNQRLCDMLGYARDELMARSVEEITHPEDYPYDREIAQRVLRGEQDTYTREKRYLRKSGEVIWVSVTGTLVRRSDGAPAYFSGVYVDITARKRAEAELTKLSRAVEQSPESIVITDADGAIEYVNDSFVEVSGYRHEEVIGRNPRILNSGRTPRSTFEAMWAALQAGRAWTGEFYNRRKDGTEYIESASISPIRGPDGEVTHYLAVKEDVTEKRRIADELERYRHRLEELVEERTAQLIEARRQAEAANEAKSAFLANMSHEIRTPMNGVLGMLDVLMQSELTHRQAEVAQIAIDSGRTLLGLIDDILDFSKIEAGRLQIEVTPVSVVELVEGLCESMVPAAGQKRVDLTVFVAPTVPALVRSDPLRLRQILFNLVGNAIKFSGGKPDRVGRVSVRVTIAQASPLQLSFAVIDNGIGMSAEQMGRLFEAFSQAEVSTTRRFGGTGLGLIICKRLADLMGGRIAVASEPGVGSTFTLTLPVDEVPVEKPGHEKPTLMGVNCLVDERSKFDVDGICCYLEHSGAAVHRIACTRDAVQFASALTGPVVAIGSTYATQTLPTNARAVLIARTSRPSAGSEAPHALSLEGGAALRRDSLLAAVAVAAGRALPHLLSPAPVSPPAAAKAQPAGAKMRILVAEDDEVNQQVILRQLDLLGYGATVAHNGADALRLWREGRYAMLLTDLHMPEMDGYELTSAIRREEERAPVAPRLPIVALTANALRGEAERATAIGMDGYLTKPLQLEILRAALDRWIGSSEAPQEAAPASAAAIDFAVVRKTIGDDEAQVNGLLSFYLSAAARQGREIHAATDAGDAVKAGTTAHKLKSSSRSVGALSLGDLCATLEKAGKAGDLAAVRSLLPAFDAELARAQAEIDVYLAGVKT